MTTKELGTVPMVLPARIDDSTPRRRRDDHPRRSWGRRDGERHHPFELPQGRRLLLREKATEPGPAKTAFGDIKVGRETTTSGWNRRSTSTRRNGSSTTSTDSPVSIGPDQSDSAGYGLYIIRVPVRSPRAKKLTRASVPTSRSRSSTSSGQLPPLDDPNLVVNDVVTQLRPIVYEIIRSGASWPASRRGRLDRRPDRSAGRLEGDREWL